MYVKKNFTLRDILRFTGFHIIWLTIWATVVVAIHEYGHWTFMNVPWVPVSIIATAVAFYVGFKNNQAYDRMWEARKIWGAIVNSSRAWGASVRGFLSNDFVSEDMSLSEHKEVERRLLYRHIAWLYALRSQLLIPTPWEHISQGKYMKKLTDSRQKRYGMGLHEDDTTERALRQHLPANEHDRLVDYQNTATQIIDQQSQDLKDLRSRNVIDDFRHMELQNILNDFYIHQGKAERIKKFPLPRQYGNMSLIFVGILIFLLPFTFVTQFHDLSETIGPWLSIPFTVLVGWVFVTMELVGDYSENPFEGLGNDIPMLSLCRVIEIDLKEMLGESDIPPKIEAINGVLL